MVNYLLEGKVNLFLVLIGDREVILDSNLLIDIVNHLCDRPNQKFHPPLLDMLRVDLVGKKISIIAQK